MKVNYDVDTKDLVTPRATSRRSEEYLAIIDFLDSDHENIVFEYDEAKTARSRQGSLARIAKKENLPVKISAKGNKVIVTYIEDGQDDEADEVENDE